MDFLKKYGEPLLPVILGGLVGFFTSGSNTYETLNNPPLSPPAIVFPIVWTILYLLMGVSFYLVNQEKRTNNRTYYISLFVNLLWPIFFFNFKLYFLSFLWLLLLIVWVLKLLKEWKDISELAYKLQIPYLIWLCFAAYLNFGVFLLN